MGWFVFGIILALTALGLIIASRFSISDSDGENYRLKGLALIGLVVGALALICVIAASVYTQDPGEVVVIKGASGSINDVDTSSGFGVSAPWNKKIGFNIRNQRIEMFSNAGGQGSDGAAITAPLENGSNVGVSITVTYSIESDESGIEDIYRQYRSQDTLLDLRLKPDIRDEVRIATAKFNAFEVKQARSQVSSDVRDALEESWDELGVVVNDVNLGDLSLDDATEEALKRVNERQAEAEAARADLERAQIDAEKTKTEALAEQAADQIVRCGATVKTETRVVAGQETEVQVVTPVPVSQCQNLLNEQVISVKYIEALERMAEKGNVIVLPSGADVSSLLNLPTPQPAG
jgi:regulator of protease activity HflC (stomatin/prohibitin superfamily)